MTEDEAKTKWCPFALGFAARGDSVVACNRFSDGPHGACKCIGSLCMAWRELKDNGVVYGGWCGLVQ